MRKPYLKKVQEAVDYQATKQFDNLMAQLNKSLRLRMAPGSAIVLKHNAGELSGKIVVKVDGQLVGIYSMSMNPDTAEVTASMAGVHFTAQHPEAMLEYLYKKGFHHIFYGQKYIP